jgi:hypothetical protein
VAQHSCREAEAKDSDGRSKKKHDLWLLLQKFVRASMFLCLLKQAAILGSASAIEYEGQMLAAAPE